MKLVELDRQRLISESDFVATLCDHNRCGGKCWANYPESRFPKWTKRRISRSNILSAVEDDYDRPSRATLNYVDIDDRGQLDNAMEIVVTKSNIDWSWGFFMADRASLKFPSSHSFAYSRAAPTEPACEGLVRRTSDYSN